jgi:hypothetical protein
MSRSLDALSSEFKPKVFELLARLTERGIAVLIVDTLRTPEEHAANLAKGTSKTSHSKHLPRRLRGVSIEPFDPANLDKSDAIDLCPYLVYQLQGPDKLQWDANDPAFTAIMEEAEKLDLRSGARWRSPRDPGHVELILTPLDRQLTTTERHRP